MSNPSSLRPALSNLRPTLEMRNTKGYKGVMAIRPTVQPCHHLTCACEGDVFFLTGKNYFGLKKVGRLDAVNNFKHLATLKVGRKVGRGWTLELTSGDYSK